jgi:putative transposase
MDKASKSGISVKGGTAMGRPLRIEFDGAFYHVTSRGDEQKEIFKTTSDRLRFQEYLSSATTRYGEVIHCFCMMGNHYHLFLQTPQGNLSQIMRHINGAYTIYYNVKRHHAGHLFQGRYKAIVVEADQYALELSRYVHLNPVRAGIVDAPEDYRWSSYPSYIGTEQRPPWLDVAFVLSMFGPDLTIARRRYQEFVEDLIGKEYHSPLIHTVASTILGGADFVETIIADHLEPDITHPDVPALRALVRRFAVENIIAKAQELVDEPKLAREVAVHVCHRYSGETLKNIGAHFGFGDSAVVKTSTRLEIRFNSECAIRVKVKEVLRALGRGNAETSAQTSKIA